MQKTITRRIYKTDSPSLQLHPVLQRIYQGRGIQSQNELEKNLEHLHHWKQLSQIHTATQLLLEAFLNKERILIIGDFDADGATATAIAVKALKKFNFPEVHYLVPNRFEFGYGLTPEIVEVAARLYSPNLIITVDNGIASHLGVETAKALGIKVLITDHHLPGATLPPAQAIVNPNLPQDNFESKAIAGCGVIFYVMLALRQTLREKNLLPTEIFKLEELLDLVALGTVADVVPLDKNNRILVHHGLKRIQTRRCSIGILALLEVAGRNPEQISSLDLGYALAPRLNAAGRLDDMSLGIECLLTDNPQKAQTIALQLNQLNQERKMIESQMQQQAWQNLSSLNTNTYSTTLPFGICLYDETWHQGVIGILAGRVKEKLHRPSIAFAKVSEDELKGSARSIEGIHIRDCLDSIATHHPDLLQKFGGHAMAAGLTINKADFKRFSRIFNATIEKHSTPELLRAEILTDGELQSQEITLDLAELLQHAGPWGTAFPEPLFDNEFELLQQYLVGEKHLKMRLSLPQQNSLFDAIAFSVDLKSWPNPAVKRVRLVYRLNINEYKGSKKVQLIVDHLQVC